MNLPVEAFSNNISSLESISRMELISTACGNVCEICESFNDTDYDYDDIRVLKKATIDKLCVWIMDRGVVMLLNSHLLLLYQFYIRIQTNCTMKLSIRTKSFYMSTCLAWKREYRTIRPRLIYTSV